MNNNDIIDAKIFAIYLPSVEHDCLLKHQGLWTFSAVMPGSMTQSTYLLGLTLYQICVLPPPSRFSILIPHSIHLIPYS